MKIDFIGSETALVDTLCVIASELGDSFPRGSQERPIRDTLRSALASLPKDDGGSGRRFEIGDIVSRRGSKGGYSQTGKVVGVAEEMGIVRVNWSGSSGSLPHPPESLRQYGKQYKLGDPSTVVIDGFPMSEIDLKMVLARGLSNSSVLSSLNYMTYPATGSSSRGLAGFAMKMFRECVSDGDVVIAAQGSSEQIYIAIPSFDAGNPTLVCAVLITAEELCEIISKLDGWNAKKPQDRPAPVERLVDTTNFIKKALEAQAGYQKMYPSYNVDGVKSVVHPPTIKFVDMSQLSQSHISYPPIADLFNSKKGGKKND